MSTVQDVDRFLAFLWEAFVLTQGSDGVRSSTSSAGSGAVFERKISATTDISERRASSTAA